METRRKVAAASDTKLKEKVILLNGVSQKKTEKGEEKKDQTDKCACQCGCQDRLDKLEGDLKEFLTWKEQKQEWEDVIRKWKTQVEEFIESTFGSTLNGPVELPCASEEGPANCDDIKTNPLDSQLDELNSDDMDTLLGLAGEDAENLEISPDLLGLGHFLLNNEYNHSDGDSNDEDVQELGSHSDDVMTDEEAEVPEVPVRNGRKMRKKNVDNSDSECFTLSSGSASSSSSEDYSSDDDFEPLKRGRGRGRGKYTLTPKMNTSVQMQKSSANTDIGSDENKKQLAEYCRKREGNIWECTVCGFMLTSLENMLLHIKYNHSSSTHTCPYCRIVVLCRSPKDAITHQAECKMRPPLTNLKSSDAKTIVQKATVPVPVPVPTPKIPVRPPVTSFTTAKPRLPADVNAEIDKFVDDLLNPEPIPSTSTQKSISSTAVKRKFNKNNHKKTDGPAVVTLSSDED